MEGVADSGVLVGHILEFEEGQGNAVQEDNDVRAAIRAIFDNGELIDGSPIVVVGFVEVEQLDEIVGNAVLDAIFDVDAVGEEVMKAAVAFDKIGTGNARELADGVVVLRAQFADLTFERLIRTERDPGDGRKTLISATAEGRALMETIPAAREAWLTGAVLGLLQPDEQQVLRAAAAIMHRIADA